jgi:uncharacterized membrane protein
MQPLLAVPIIAALLHRAYSRKSLTPLGLVVAGLTAIAHALNPWSLPLILLLVFYVGGTKATKVHFTSLLFLFHPCHPSKLNPPNPKTTFID